MVIGDLTEMGYDCQWCIVSASDCGAPHKRDRFWLLADSDLQHGQRRSQPLESISNPKRSWSELNRCNSKVADTDSERQQELHSSAIASKARQHSRRLAKGWRESWWASEPDVGRVANRVAARVDRLKAVGNGQVPIVAATAFRILSGAVK